MCCRVAAGLRPQAMSHPRQEHRHGLPGWLRSPLQHLSRLSLTTGHTGIRKQGQISWATRKVVFAHPYSIDKGSNTSFLAGLFQLWSVWCVLLGARPRRPSSGGFGKSW